MTELSPLSWHSHAYCCKCAKPVGGGGGTVPGAAGGGWAPKPVPCPRHRTVPVPLAPALPVPPRTAPVSAQPLTPYTLP